MKCRTCFLGPRAQDSTSSWNALGIGVCVCASLHFPAFRLGVCDVLQGASGVLLAALLASFPPVSSVVLGLGWGAVEEGGHSFRLGLG